MKKKYAKDSLLFVGTGIGLGVGSQVLGSIGGTAATNAQAGIGKLSGAMKPMGSIMAAGMVMDSLKMLEKKSKKK